MTVSIRRRMMIGGLLTMALAGPASAGSSDDTFRIGIVGPRSGAAARWGDFAWRGATLAADQINAAGGLLGKKIELFPGDSRCVPAEGVSATQQMINSDNVAVIIGDVCSSVTLAMEPVVEAAKVLLLNAASSNPAITYKAGVGGFKWTFRNYPTDELRASVVLQYATKQKGYRKYAVLAIDSDYGRGAIGFSKKYLATLDAQFVSEDYFKDSETDFRPVLTKIGASGAQAILMYSLPDTTVTIVRQMREMGMAGKIALVGSGQFANPAVIKAAPDVINGAVEVNSWVPGIDSPRSEQFVEEYKHKFGNELPDQHAYSHWETIHLLAAAAKSAKSTTADALREALKTLRYDSAMGPIAFDDHNQAQLPMVLSEIIDGKVVLRKTFTQKIDYPK